MKNIIFSMEMNGDGIKQKYQQKGNSVRVYKNSQKKLILLSAHGNTGEYKNGFKVSDPIGLLGYFYFWKNRGWNVKISCCHPMDVSEFLPELKEFMIGTDRNYNGNLWRSHSENSIDVYYEGDPIFSDDDF